MFSYEQERNSVRSLRFRVGSRSARLCAARRADRTGETSQYNAQKTGLDPASWPDLDPASWEKIVRGCGGPPRYYRPMERPGLWRRFADTVTTPASALEFVREFGLLTEFEIRSPRGLRFGDKFDPFDTLRNENTVDFVLNSARGLREISHALNNGERQLAAMLFSRSPPPMTATINLPKRGSQRLDLNIVPSDLRSALYL